MVTRVTGRVHLPISRYPTQPFALVWPVGNDGNGRGQAQATLSVIGRGQVAAGAVVEVPAGARAEVSVEWANNLSPGAYMLITFVLDVTPGASAAAGDLSDAHQFPLSIIGPRFAAGNRVNSPGGAGTVNFSNLRLRFGQWFYEYMVTLDDGALAAYPENQLSPA